MWIFDDTGHIMTVRPTRQHYKIYAFRNFIGAKRFKYTSALFFGKIEIPLFFLLIVPINQKSEKFGPCSILLRQHSSPHVSFSNYLCNSIKYLWIFSAFCFTFLNKNLTKKNNGYQYPAWPVGHLSSPHALPSMLSTLTDPSRALAPALCIFFKFLYFDFFYLCICSYIFSMLPTLASAKTEEQNQRN